VPFDPENMKILERFDPEGIIDVKKIEDMDIFLKNKFKTLVNDDNFKYISPKDYGIINSFQKLSDEINRPADRCFTNKRKSFEQSFYN
jgi:hypothetical protein